MERVDVKTGFKCNNRCIFCVQGNKRDLYGNKSTDEVKKVLDDARTVSDAIVFTGGEVTIRPDFLELVRYAKEIGFKCIQVQTNGRMLAYRKFCEQTIEAGATEFSPALHGHTAELHDFQTNSPGSFQQTVKCIQNLRALKQIIITNSVITSYNYKTLPELAKLLTALKVNQYQFAFVHALGTAGEYFEKVVPQKSKAESYIKKGMDIGRKAKIRCCTEAIPFCFMRDYEEHVAERFLPRTRVFDQEVIVDDYTEYRLTEGKVKGPPCRECALTSICEGPWREYPEHFGWDEFKPFPELTTKHKQLFPALCSENS